MQPVHKVTAEFPMPIPETVLGKPGRGTPWPTSDEELKHWSHRNYEAIIYIYRVIMSNRESKVQTQLNGLKASRPSKGLKSVACHSSMSAESSRSQKHSCLNCMKCKNRAVDCEGFSTSHKLLRDNARCFQRSTSYKHKHFC